MLAEWKKILVISGLAAMLVKPNQAENRPHNFAPDTHTQEQKAEDQRQKVAELIIMLENTPLDEKTTITRTLLAIGNLRYARSASHLLVYFNFDGVILPEMSPRQNAANAMTVINAAPTALGSLDDQALPVIINEVASRDGMLQSNEGRGRAWLSIVYHLKDKINKLPSLLQGYSDQYRSQGRRLRRLTAEVPNLPDLPLEAQKPYTPPTDVKGRTARLTRIFELEDILTDPVLTEGEQDRGNAKIVLAMNELAQVHAVEALPLIVDKLDDHKNPPQEDDKFIPPIMAADPQGLLSTNIAEAAPNMVRRFGYDALPALIRAVSMSRRTPKFQSTALQLLTELAGGPINAKALMNKAADEDDAKAQRLRDWVLELVKQG